MIHNVNVNVKTWFITSLVWYCRTRKVIEKILFLFYETFSKLKMQWKNKYANKSGWFIVQLLLQSLWSLGFSDRQTTINSPFKKHSEEEKNSYKRSYSIRIVIHYHLFKLKCKYWKLSTTILVAISWGHIPKDTPS